MEPVPAGAGASSDRAILGEGVTFGKRLLAAQHGAIEDAGLIHNSLMATRQGSTGISQTFPCPINGTKSSRNLVVCIDGTSNQFGTKNTNIVELYSHIMKSDTQLTYYTSGLGTIAKIAGRPLGHGISNNLDMAFGRNLHEVIMASYGWLSDNYQDGDSIFLFGFSRGAYQVRALAGMIARVGLLLPGNKEQIPFAFELYSKTGHSDSILTPTASVNSSGSLTKESKQRFKYAELARTFQNTFCRKGVHIHFVGVWDTVSSVGFFRRRILPCTTTTCEHICYFRHALALDERRVKFLPEYAFGGRSIHNVSDRIKEVWFPGSHSDVGGGNRRNERLQSGDIPLLWMRSQAIHAGLDMVPANVVWKIEDLNKPITRSLRHVWWSLELLPLKRLQYNNSNRQTFSPHFGAPRTILPGQKVHASALFKNNYRPYAQFYSSPEGWPEPLLWNDASSHQRLPELTDMWEKDIFDEGSVETLFASLKQGKPNLDALDRLAFMASFQVCRDAIGNDARQVLPKFLKREDKLMRLSTAVAYCELGWDWPLEMNHTELGQQIVDDVSGLLLSDSDCRRACIYIPSLCKKTDLKGGLLNKENLQRLARLCDSIPVVKRGEGTSTVAFHSAQALEMLMKLNVDFAEKLIDFSTVTDITDALHSKCGPVVVSVLSVVDGLAKYERGREVMRRTVPTLLKLIKNFDDFVAPAAIRVLCSLLPDNEIRTKMLYFGVPSVFLEVLYRCSDETRQVTCDALAKFLQHGDIRDELCRDGYLRKLAKRAQSHNTSTHDGAVMALVEIGKGEASRTTVMDAIRGAKMIDVLIGRLKWKLTAFSAASTLAHLMKLDDIALILSGNENVREGIVRMLRRRWFDAKDGHKVLSELLECERFRTAILEAGAVDRLHKMVDSQRFKDIRAGLNYLRVFAGFDTGGPSGALTLLVETLRSPHRRVQRIAMDMLQLLSAQGDLHPLIVERLLNLLKDRRASVISFTCTLLGSLAMHDFVRETIANDDSFMRLVREHNNGLDLQLDRKDGPCHLGEARESIERLIKSMQVGESDEVGVGPTENQLAEDFVVLSRMSLGAMAGDVAGNSGGTSMHFS